MQQRILTSLSFAGGMSVGSMKNQPRRANGGCTRRSNRLRMVAVGLLLCFSLSGLGQARITIADPETWTTRSLTNYVGQTVVFEQPMYVCNNYDDLTIAPRRIYAPTNQAIPRSTDYSTIVSLNSGGTMTLSGVSGYHRMGEQIYDLEVYVRSQTDLEWRGGTFRGNTRADLEAGLPDLDITGEHRLLVCAMNLEYYLVDNLGTGYGPDSYSQHQRQREKTSKALAKIGADIYGLVEIEQGQSALREIAEDLSDNTGHPYTYIDDGGSASGSYTKSGYVYRSDRVRPNGQLYSNNEAVSNRKKIQAFEEIETGELFFFSLNHFKAKSGTGTGADANTGDGQGQFNATRVREANSVLAQYNRLRSQYHESDILIMGDLNAYGKEDPITTMTDRGMIDLYRAFHADSGYSYTYHGQAGYLDHALCNSTLYPQITGMAAYHINSDESDYYTYDRSSDRTMFRCSDHDPVLVGLALDSTIVVNSDPNVSNVELVERDGQQVVVFGNYITINNAYGSGEGSFYRVYTMEGLLVGGGEITGNQYPIATPDGTGVYIVLIYTDGQTYQRKLIVP